VGASYDCPDQAKKGELLYMKVSFVRGISLSLSLLICILPALAADENIPPLRGIEADQPVNTQLPSSEVAPVFPTMPNRQVPADPGVIADKSKYFKTPLGSFSEDSLNFKTTAAENLVPVGNDKLPPIKLEATYNQPISLKDVLTLTRDNNLPIKIAQTDALGSKYKLIGSFGAFLPSLSMNYVPQRLKSGGTEVRTSPFFVTLIYPVFLGGGAAFTSLQRLHEMRAARQVTYKYTNDALLDSYLKYYDVVLNWALLDLRAKSLEVADTQLSINKDLKTAGLGTDFEVMQSKTLYALEKQKLVRQEVELRRAALKLCVVLNHSVLVNLVPSDNQINRQALVAPTQSPELLTSLAVQNRPELARWEELRLAARNATRAAGSGLLPRAAFFTNNSTNIGGGDSTVIIPTGGGSAAGGVTSSINGGSNSSYSAGFILNWLIAGAGVESASNILVGRQNTRRAILEGREELLRISAEVRDAYLDTRASETEIDVTSDAVQAATEQLRMATVRISHQIGTNLEVIQAQKDYIEALSRRIEAFVRYKQSQARLLHATGLISVDTLTATQPQRFQVRRTK
jgi:outer membrane protein TolC